MYIRPKLDCEYTENTVGTNDIYYVPLKTLGNIYYIPLNMLGKIVVKFTGA